MVSTDTTVSERLVQAVATETNTDPLELPPLYMTIDPDALDAMINVMIDGEVSFRYAGSTVTVESSGAIMIDDDPITTGSADDVMSDVPD